MKKIGAVFFVVSALLALFTVREQLKESSHY